MDYKKKIAEKIAQLVDINENELREYIEIPPNKDMGDYSFPCFRLAKVMKKSPQVIAEELKSQIKLDDIIEKTDVAGGYLNFFINKTSFVENTLKEIAKKENDYGKSEIGKGQTIVIDYSAPNIAKPFHVGHLRSTVIGGALYKIYQYLGYHVIGINHLGDWGMGVCKTIAGYEMWKEEYDFSISPINAIAKIYARFNKEEKENPSITDKARNALQRLEAGDEETVKLWKWIISISIESYNKIYDLIGCKFDSYNGEAFYNDKMDRVIKILEDKNLLVESEGAKVVMMPDNMPPCIIITSAGTTIYATRDLAALLYRIDNYHFDKALYVVGGEQSLHFKQVFKTLELMGYEKYAKNCVHIPFGLILNENGEKIGSRKGTPITLEEIFNEAIEKSLQIIEEKNSELENKEEVAKKVGVGAIIFNDLANNRIKDEIFDWKQILNFAGETGPYMQYTYVRTQSILRNANCEIDSNVDYSKLLDDEAIDVVKKLKEFPNIIIASADKNEPSLISRYLIDLAQSFSRFYNEHHIICEDKNTQNARLMLTKAVGITIKNGLNILGIETPEKM
ncbi:MAG: arginine--tRNA ligase [Clostridia bacterium]|nr:arginine--tRNA ligase [Clostridia bacterium]